MGFRTIIIENEYSVGIKLDNLIIKKNNEDVWIPLSDISTVVVDNAKTTMTARALISLANNNVAVIFCDLDHNPIGYYSSYDSHSRSSKMLKYQIENINNTDELWKLIIQNKISNQRDTIQMLNLNIEQQSIEKFDEYINAILPDDINNIEAHAAKLYFELLGGVGFNRRNDDLLLNCGLNYGYAILRSYLAKLCVGTGLNTQIGLHHKNEYNRFNLVDDLMEPFRPFIDIAVYNILLDQKYFTSEHRYKIINVLNHKCKFKNQVMYLSSILEDYVEQFSRWYKGDNVEFAFPDINYYLGEKDAV